MEYYRKPLGGMPAKRRARDKLLHGKPASDLPDFIAPELATLVERAPVGDEWVHVIRFDGYRGAMRLKAGKVRMLTRSEPDWTARFGPIAEAGAALAARWAHIDGDIVVLDDMGVSDFGALQEALSEGVTSIMVYFAFDLLHVDQSERSLARSAERAGPKAHARFEGLQQSSPLQPGLPGTDSRRCGRTGGRGRPGQG